MRLVYPTFPHKSVISDTPTRFVFKTSGCSKAELAEYYGICRSSDYRLYG
jgi:hypothetical protein